MNWEVEFTDQARRDLRDILDYISYELQEPQVAVKLVRQITKEILSLEQLPMRYRLYERNLGKIKACAVSRSRTISFSTTRTKPKTRFMPSV